MLHYIILGGPVMIPIGIVSIIALSIVIEKLFSLSRLTTISPMFFAGISESIRRRDWHQAQIICRNFKFPISQIFDAGLSELGKSATDLHAVEEAVRLKGDNIVFQTESGLKVLGALVTVLPLLGFLGTIIGLIGAFQEWQALGTAITVSQLSGGIYQAMITTAAGLMLAIPYYLIHHWLVSGLEEKVLRLSYFTTEFISKIRQAVIQAEETRVEIEKPTTSHAQRK